MSQHSWKTALENDVLKQIPYPDEGAVEVEVWNQDPGILGSNGSVDPLSLYLSLRKTDDERIQIALDELMRKIQW